MTTNDTRSPRERAEALYDSEPRVFTIEGPKDAYVKGFLARDAEPTTVSVEQIEKAAMDMRDNQSPAHRTDWPFRVWMRLARSAFRAAGFRIEGDEA